MSARIFFLRTAPLVRSRLSSLARHVDHSRASVALPLLAARAQQVSSLSHPHAQLTASKTWSPLGTTAGGQGSFRTHLWSVRLFSSSAGGNSDDDDKKKPDDKDESDDSDDEAENTENRSPGTLEIVSVDPDEPGEVTLGTSTRVPNFAPALKRVPVRDFEQCRAVRHSHRASTRKWSSSPLPAHRSFPSS